MSEQAKRPSPIRGLVAIMAIILVVGLWWPALQTGRMPWDGLFTAPKSGSVQQLANLNEQLETPEQEAARLARERERQPRTPRLADYTPTGAGAADLETEQFPATDDFETSSSLELANERGPGELIGWVSDSQSLPVENAGVTLQWEEAVPEGEKAPELKALSDRNGIFRLAEVPPGTWTVVARKENMATATQTGVVVHSGERTGPLELTLEAELTATGTVSAGGIAVRGARVSAWRDLLTVHAGEVASVRVMYDSTLTGDDGSFTLRGLAPGPMIVGVRAPGHAPLEQAISVVPKLAPLRLQLAAEEFIGGVVRNELGRAVAGVKLTIVAADAKDKRKPYRETTSREDGSFLFRELPPRQLFELTAKAPLYADTGPLPVASGSTTNVVIMTTGGAIEGRVTSFDTGAPVVGIRLVAVSDIAGERLALTTKSNSEGRYRIARLPKGTYNVAVFSETLTTEARTGVKVDQRQTVKDVNFVVYPGIALEGTVSDGDTGERIANATVTLASRVGPGLLTARKISQASDDAGRFRFPNLPQGIYTVSARREGYMPAQGQQASARVELLRGARPEPVDIKLFPGGVISGIVTDPMGVPVGESLVQLYHAPGTPTRIDVNPYKQVTGAAGRFVMEGLPTQQEVHLRVSAVAPGWAKANSENIVLNSAQRIRAVKVVLTAGGTVEVNVSSTTGEAIADATLAVSHNSFPGDPNPESWGRKTGLRGEAVYTNIPPGRFNVSASKEGFLSAGGSVTVAEGGLVTLNLKMEPAFRLRGRVVNDRGEPIRGGTARARAERGATGGGAAPINDQGQFEIRTLGKGTFTLDLEANFNTDTGNRRFTNSFVNVLPNQGVGEITFEMPSSGVIEGSVSIPADSPPPAHYRIDIRGDYFDRTNTKRTISLGHQFPYGQPFAIGSLPPGVYTVTASAGNFLPSAPRELRVPSPGSASVGDLRLQAGGRIKYQVVDSRTGEPVGGVRGTLTPEGPAAKTDDNGRATHNPVKPGVYTISFSHDDYLPTEAYLIKVTRNSETDAGVIRVDSGGVLFGRVTNRDRAPLRGIRVEVVPVGGGTTKAVNTDAGGRYTIKGLPPGGVLVTFSGTIRGRQFSRTLETTVSSLDDKELNVVLDADATLEAMLVAGPDVFIDRAIVRVYPMRANGTPLLNGPISVSINGGRFLLEDLVSGDFLVTVQAPSSTGRTVYWADSFNIPPGRTSRFIQAGAISYFGTILDRPGGLPVTRQEVRFDHISSPVHGIAQLRNWWQFTAISDEAGRFSFSYLPDGVYSVVAHSDRLGLDILDIIQLTRSSATNEQILVFEGSR